ncbi:putative UPF0481 protein At3g02645 [Momordica charantia]|uniref:UPF0481 protein At3g02645 n=1 Tax=Momordica charantia TaxID=3673 RepID=A0A6J1DRH1_MOMCH|nr:putative UPF0481 protein At3g02645 [Momordica charantia]
MQWVVQINELLQRNDFHTAFETPTSIFQVPDCIRNDSPEAFTPRRISLGPYHHFRPELLKLELYKLLVAKKVKHQIQLPEFHQLVSDTLKPLELQIRACFDKYLEVGCESLSWMMLIDALFLIRLLHIFAEVEVKRDLNSKLSWPELDVEHQQLYLNHEASSMGRDEIICDALMVENQIPFRVLKGILVGNEIINDLPVQLYKFCVLVSPFGLPSHRSLFFNRGSRFPNLPQTFEQSHHLLQFLYLFILNQREIEMIRENAGDAFIGFLCLCCEILGSLLQMCIEGVFKESNDLIQSLFTILKTLVQPSSLQDDLSIIPSASRLKKLGVKFEPSYSLRGITFSKEKTSLRLPTITLDSNSQVILRNLVAFEVIAKLSPPCLSQYAAIMNGLIETTNDVKILTKANIIINHLESDEEVVKLFDGFPKSESSQTESSSESSSMVDMDEIIEKLNKYYESKWRIKVAKFVKKYVSPTAKILAILVVVLLIIFVIARIFCGLLFSHCPRVLKS